MKFLLIDGANFAHRARAGFDGGEKPFLRNFFRNLRALVGQHEPDRVIYTLEGHPKARYEEAPDYKANRIIETATLEGEKKHAEMSSFFEDYGEALRLMQKHFPITIVRHPDHECDDVIHNFALRILRTDIPGNEVKMSEEFKTQMWGSCSSDAHLEWDEEVSQCMKCSGNHIEEFRDSVGIVAGMADMGDADFPFMDVRWKPHGLRYAYKPDDLVSASEVVIASSDSDFIQSLEIPNVKLWNMRTKSWIEKPPYDYTQWKALKGDATDNIKGIPGVGEKTATKLVSNPTKLASFLSDPEKAQVYERNIRLIRFKSFSADDWEGVVKAKADANWEEVRSVFNSFSFNAITNEKSWKKFVNTFEKANK